MSFTEKAKRVGFGSSVMLYCRKSPRKTAIAFFIFPPPYIVQPRVAVTPLMDEVVGYKCKKKNMSCVSEFLASFQPKPPVKHLLLPFFLRVSAPPQPLYLKNHPPPSLHCAPH